MEKYATLKNHYPDFLSLDELSRVCKIAKRTARYLVENGIVPAIDTGKKTWRYRIAIDDVITYLKCREVMGSMVPPGAVTSRSSKQYGLISSRKTFSEIVTPGKEHEVADYFKYVYADFNEVLTVVDIAMMTGLNESTILQLARSGRIKSLASTPRYLIPKQYLLDFVVTRRFLEAKTSSELFIKLLGGFEIWKNAK
jgi:hypothetical protein